VEGEYLFPSPFGCAVVGNNRRYDKEWQRILDEADVKDFRWHDLKHVALTYLLDNGYTERDLMQCGIQYTREMVDHYYHHDAEKAPVIPGYEKPQLRIAV